MVRCYFEDGCLADKYQRNNKDSGQKNLRCFPSCDHRGHVRYGFCGQAVEMCVSGLHLGEKLHAWSEFCLHDAETNIRIGDIWDKAEIIDKLERTRKHPSRDWIKGELNESNTAFKFNKARLGWHYSWVSNVHTCDSLHVLRAYIFAEVPGNSNSICCIDVVNSTPFRIFCSRRRQRKNASSSSASVCGSPASDISAPCKPVPQPIKTEYFASPSSSNQLEFSVSTPTYQNIRANCTTTPASFSPKKRKSNAMDMGVNVATMASFDMHHPAFLKKYKSEPANNTEELSQPKPTLNADTIQTLWDLLRAGSSSVQNPTESVIPQSSASAQAPELQNLLLMSLSSATSNATTPTTQLFGSPNTTSTSLLSLLGALCSKNDRTDLNALLNQQLLLKLLSSSSNDMNSSVISPTSSPPQTPGAYCGDENSKWNSHSNLLGYHF